MKAVLVPCEDVPQVVELPASDDAPEMIRCLGGLVGGRIEALSMYDREDVTVWGNDEAKLIGLPENPRASLLVFGDRDQARSRSEVAMARYRAMGFAVLDAGSGDPREPFVAGPVVIVGYDGRTGASLPVPDDLVELLIEDGS